ncbi:MAG: hypothetical protein AB2672_01530 [Candidatus Thiodiazotropha endolucinida]
MSLYERFYRRPIITFIILIASGLTFGAMTVNIFACLPPTGISS